MQVMEKRGKLAEATIEQYIMVFILIVLLFKVIASLLPEAQSAGDELQASGAPLGDLFSSEGVVWIIVMAAILILLVRSFLKKGRK